MVHRIMWIVGLLSVALLGFELSLMRMLSYAQWYHFAYMIISIALLGFGASGTFLSLFHPTLNTKREYVLAVGTFLCALSLALAPTFLSLVPIDPFLLIAEPVRAWQLLVFYLIGFIPFFFGGLVIGLSFMLFPEHVGRTYFFNLVGSGFGILGTAVLLNWVHPNSLPTIMTLVALPALWLAIAGLPKVTTKVAAFLIAFLALVRSVSPANLEISQFKSLSKELLLPGAKIIEKKLSPLGVVEVVESPAIRYAPGLSLSYPGPIPSSLDVFVDGERIGTIGDARDSSFFTSFHYSASSLPYRLLRHPRVLVAGSGTGHDVQMAKYFGAEHVTAVEMNASVIELLQKNFLELTNQLARHEKVTIIHSEARSYLARETNCYDLVVVPILEGMTASAAGMQALFENYFFTVESFSSALDRVTPQGILMVSAWMTFPPRSSLKIISIITEALRKSGAANPGDHLAAIRSWSTVTVLAKKQPWTPREVDSIRAFCEGLSFDLILIPNIRPEETNRYNRLEPDYLYEAARAVMSGDADYFERYPFFVKPATDDKPYFGHFFSWKSLSFLQEIYGTRHLAFFELSYVLLLVTLLQLVILSFLLIPLPVFMRRNVLRSAGSLPAAALYFGGIGIGYMFVEILMIQKFILFLGHPTYSVSVVIATMLIFSGIGSYSSSRLNGTDPRILRSAFIGIVVLLLLYSVALSSLLRFVLPLDFTWKVVICVSVISPLAFSMGLPFPVGIGRVMPSLIPWAWGVNGYFSVISASLATLVAMELGFTAVFVCSLVAYGSAAWVSTRLQSRVGPA